VHLAKSLQYCTIVPLYHIIYITLPYKLEVTQIVFSTRLDRGRLGEHTAHRRPRISIGWTTRPTVDMQSIVKTIPCPFIVPVEKNRVAIATDLSIL